MRLASQLTFQSRLIHTEEITGVGVGTNFTMKNGIYDVSFLADTPFKNQP